MAGDDHVVVDVDGLAKSKDGGAAEKVSEGANAPVTSASPSVVVDLVREAEEGGGEDEPLIQAAECRICQEEDSVKNLEKPCACSGSLKYAHRACVQRWCNEKGDTTCEICHQLMALLLLRHTLSISDNDGSDDDASAMFSLFLLRAAGFLLPCYIMAWIFSILHRRRQQQEEAALAAAEVAFILESARGRALQFAIAPETPATPQHEPAPAPAPPQQQQQ